MDNMYAFAMGEANRGKELMVFDWDKAAKLIKEAGVKTASAGLQGDWEWTGGNIFLEGEPITDQMETSVYLASTWAIPELKINNNYIDCYKMQSKTDNWDAKTLWPQSALDILGK